MPGSSATFAIYQILCGHCRGHLVHRGGADDIVGCDRCENWAPKSEAIVIARAYINDELARQLAVHRGEQPPPRTVHRFRFAYEAE
ncbi:hypothetical protein ACXN5S_17810 [Pseudoroseicyclus sp. H15]